MTHLRLPIAIALGGLFTISMFWLLWTLVEPAFDVGDMPEATRIEFSRMRRDTEVATKRDEKVERERPPPAPEMPRMAFSARRRRQQRRAADADARRARRDVANDDERPARTATSSRSSVSRRTIRRAL